MPICKPKKNNIAEKLFPLLPNDNVFGIFLGSGQSNSTTIPLFLASKPASKSWINYLFGFIKVGLPIAFHFHSSHSTWTTSSRAHKVDNRKHHFPRSRLAPNALLSLLQARHPPLIPLKPFYPLSHIILPVTIVRITVHFPFFLFLLTDFISGRRMKEESDSAYPSGRLIWEDGNREPYKKWPKKHRAAHCRKNHPIKAVQRRNRLVWIGLIIILKNMYVAMELT